MVVKKILNKIRIGKNVLYEQGILGLHIRSLQYLQKRIGKKPKTTLQVFTKAPAEQLLEIDFSSLKSWKKTKKKGPFTFLWIMPPPGKGSGGHMNIFRFIRTLEKQGHHCEIYLDLADTNGSTEHIRAVLDGYPVVDAVNAMYWLKDGRNRKENKDFDGIFATSWETAYSAYTLDANGKRFYFVQDFEPYFYPVGSLYSLAENTYKLGFFGITAGGWLSKKLHEDYYMETAHYDFGAEDSTYFLTSSPKRNSIFFYARPYTERRGFEVGVLALELFHKRHPEYKIVFAGWDVSDYNLPFPYENLKTLELSELNDVYNRCAAGLVLSYTNMSLLPLELMASGAIPVVNDAPNNRLVSNNKYIAYTKNDPVSFADKLCEIVERKDLNDYSKKASSSAHSSSWNTAENKFIEIVHKRMSQDV